VAFTSRILGVGGGKGYPGALVRDEAQRFSALRSANPPVSDPDPHTKELRELEEWGEFRGVVSCNTTPRRNTASRTGWEGYSRPLMAAMADWVLVHRGP